MTLTLMLLSTVQAAPLSLQWDADPIRYHGELLLQRGEPIALLSANNIDVRATTVMLAADMTCTGEAAGKNWKVECAIDEIAIQGGAYTPDEQERLDTIFTEYSALMSTATVQLVQRADGRLRSVDLEGIDKSDERMSEIHESLRLLMRRLFAPLDIQLPKKGSAEVGETWKHKGGAVALELFSKYGTFGGSSVTYTLAAAEGGMATVTSEGRGNIGVSSTGATMEMEDGSISTSASSELYNTLSFGNGRLDTTSGHWLFVDSSAEGQRNQAVAKSASQFIQAAWLGRINDDGTIEGRDGPYTPGSADQ